jgi:methylated-DNA-[protein]-cysteine S-methyltransferase
MGHLRGSAVTIATSLGRLTAQFSDRGVCSLSFGGTSRKAAPALAGHPHLLVARLRTLLLQYAAGRRGALDIPLDLSAGTPFQRKVWETLRSIPYGETRSYGWVARQIGKPRASRAVGAACGANPIAIIVPCHRVVAGDGTLGGYTGGLAIKRRLLRLEGSWRR